MCLFEAVVQQCWVWGASGPELFYELTSLFVCCQLEKGATFLGRDKVDNILRQPKSSEPGEIRKLLIFELLAARPINCLEAWD